MLPKECSLGCTGSRVAPHSLPLSLRSVGVEEIRTREAQGWSWSGVLRDARCSVFGERHIVSDLL